MACFTGSVGTGALNLRSPTAITQNSVHYPPNTAGFGGVTAGTVSARAQVDDVEAVAGVAVRVVGDHNRGGGAGLVNDLDDFQFTGGFSAAGCGADLHRAQRQRQHAQRAIAVIGQPGQFPGLATQLATSRRQRQRRSKAGALPRVSHAALLALISYPGQYVVPTTGGSYRTTKCHKVLPLIAPH